MWFKVVALADAQTNWEPRWGLRQQGDGPYVPSSATQRLLFVALADAIDWVGRHHPEAFIELPSSTVFRVQ